MWIFEPMHTHVLCTFPFYIPIYMEYNAAEGAAWIALYPPINMQKSQV